MSEPSEENRGRVSLDPMKVAVVIPAYNASETIERAVASACSQSLPDGYQLDVIVVDDCSTDATLTVLEGLQKPFKMLRVVRQSENAGPSAARNRALETSDAAWFTPLDSDDFMAPGRLSNLLQIALEGDWHMVADNLLMTYGDTPEKVERKLWQDKPAGCVTLSLALFVRQNLHAVGDRSELGFLKPLIDRRGLGSDPIYRSDMRFGEDYDLYTRLLAGRARACLIEPQGYYAVQRRGSLSHSQTAIDFARLVQSDIDLLDMPDLAVEARAVIKVHLKQSRNHWVWLRAIEAVKDRDIAAFVRCFLVSPAASGALIGRLFEQAVIRSGRAFSRKSANVVR